MTVFTSLSDTHSNNKTYAQKDITLYACFSLAFLIGSFSLTMPYLQSRRDELQCDSFCQGSLTSLRSILSLIGSVLMGRVSDALVQRQWSHGRSVCLYIGNLASLIGLILSITIPTQRGLWLSIIPGALFQQNFSIFKAMITESLAMKTQLQPQAEQGKTKEEDQDTSSSNSIAARTAKFGQLGMSAGVAFMIGPVLGTMFVSNFTTAVYWAMSLICISTCFLLQISSIVRYQQRMMRCTTQSSQDHNIHSSSSSNSNNISTTMKILWTQTSFSTIQNNWYLVRTKKGSWFHKGKGENEDIPVYLTPAAIFLMAIRLCMAMAFHIYQLIWTVSLKKRFQFTPTDHGRFMSFVGLTYALSQGFIAKWIVHTFITSSSLPAANTTGAGIHNNNNNNNNNNNIHPHVKMSENSHDSTASSSDLSASSASSTDTTKTIQQRLRRVRVIQVCCVILGLGRYFAFHTTRLTVVYGIFSLIITSLGVMNTILTSDTSSIAPISQLGSLYGVMESVESASGIFGPFLGGFIQYPLLSVVFMYTIVFLLVTFGYDRFIIQKDTIEIGNIKKRT